MDSKIKINENERKVLEQLAEDDEMAFHFAGLTTPEMDTKAVRRACRSLVRKGLAAFHRGLFNEDGMVAGSGYGITEAGSAFICPCDICGKRAIYDYEIDAAGKNGWEIGFDKATTQRRRECEQHYKQSIKSEQASLI